MGKWKDKKEFKDRVYYFAKKIEIAVNLLALRPMRNKWASCSTNGNLSFNSELLDLDKKLGDYVIVHELLHFRVPNHGKLWKSLMRVYLGNYENIADRLNNIVDKQS